MHKISPFNSHLKAEQISITVEDVKQQGEFGIPLS